MNKNGHLAEHSAFYDFLSTSPSAATEKFRAHKLWIRGLGNVDIEPYKEALQNFGIEVHPDFDSATLGLIITDDYLHDDLKQFALEARGNHQPFILIKPVGKEIWIGPLFTPTGQGCHACLTKRLLLNQLGLAYVQKKLQKGSFSISFAALALTKSAAVQLALTEIVKWIVNPQFSQLNQQMLSLDFIKMKMEKHSILADPFCSVCGRKNENSFAPALLQASKIQKSEDGGYRTISPEETCKKYSHLVSRITGIVSDLEHRQFGSLHVYAGGHNFAIRNVVKGIEPSSFRGDCMGKGKTKSQSQASCLCEGIERYSGVFQGNEPRKKESFKALKEVAIHPHDFLLLSEKQRLKTASLTFSEDEEIEWSPLWSFTQNRIKYLPTSLCYYAYPPLHNAFHYSSDSNGCAAGNTLEEAVLQGFFELVERDSAAIWWYNRVELPRVDLKSFPSSYIQECISDYAKMQREVWALDLTSDLDIPVFIAFSRNSHQAQEEIIWGLGCHLDATLALERAFTELHQATLFLPERKKNKPLNEVNPDFYNWLHEATLEHYPFIKGATTLKTASDYTFPTSDDFIEIINICRQKIEEQGMEMLLLDQTRAETGLHVVKVIIPGMRHFWPRFAPGRLYDVPVKMGWLKKPLQESELTGICLFL